MAWRRAEMETMMNNTITKWLEQLDTKDQANKELLKQGLQKLASEGNESGVWEVVACASSNWAANVNQIESLTNEINGFKEKEKQLQGGLFGDESARVGEKRKADDERAGGEKANDMWGEIETMFLQGGGVRGVDSSQQHAPRVDVNSLR